MKYTYEDGEWFIESTELRIRFKKAIQEGDVASAAQMLNESTIVNQLNLSHWPFIKHSLKQLTQVFETNSTIYCLSLSHNALGQAEMARVCEVLRTNKTIKYIHLDGNKITTSVVAEIEEAIKFNATLKMVNLMPQHPPLEDSGLEVQDQRIVLKEDMNERNSTDDRFFDSEYFPVPVCVLEMLKHKYGEAVFHHLLYLVSDSDIADDEDNLFTLEPTAGPETTNPYSFHQELLTALTLVTTPIDALATIESLLGLDQDFCTNH